MIDRCKLDRLYEAFTTARPEERLRLFARIAGTLLYSKVKG